MWKDPGFWGVAVGSNVLFSGLSFGFLRLLAEWSIWASVLIALPSGILAFSLLPWLQMSSDAPSR